MAAAQPARAAVTPASTRPPPGPAGPASSPLLPAFSPQASRWRLSPLAAHSRCSLASECSMPRRGCGAQLATAGSGTASQTLHRQRCGWAGRLARQPGIDVHKMCGRPAQQYRTFASRCITACKAAHQLYACRRRCRRRNACACPTAAPPTPGVCRAVRSSACTTTARCWATRHGWRRAGPAACGFIATTLR